MRTSKLDPPHIKLLIAHAIANGHSQREIGQSLGVSQPTIHRLAKQSDICELVRQEERKFFLQVEEMLEKIRNDPRFIAEFQAALEKELFNCLWQR